MNDMETVQRAKCKCSRCGWDWVAQTAEPPRRCANPDCRSPYWDSFPVVYVMKNYPTRGLFKIGCTANEKRRYSARKMRNDIVIRIRATDNLRTLEHSIHELFSNRRRDLKQPEVFALTNDDIELLRKISRSESPEQSVRKILHEAESVSQ